SFPLRKLLSGAGLGRIWVRNEITLGSGLRPATRDSGPICVIVGAWVSLGRGRKSKFKPLFVRGRTLDSFRPHTLDLQAWSIVSVGFWFCQLSVVSGFALIGPPGLPSSDSLDFRSRMLFWRSSCRHY